MSIEDARHLTVVTTLRLFGVFSVSALVVAGTRYFGLSNALAAYIFAVSMSLASLTLPPLVVLVGAAACRRPIGDLPRWILVAGVVAAALGCALLITIRSPWTLLLFAAGVWLLLVAAGAVISLGLWERWSR